MDNYKSYRYKVWLKQAEYDLSASRLSYGNAFYEWACFQAEQSAEKAMKGLMVFCGYKPPKVHKLSILLKIIRRLRPDISGNINIQSLQSYTFVSRYPFILPGDNSTPHDFIDEENAGECVAEAEIVLKIMSDILDKK